MYFHLYVVLPRGQARNSLEIRGETGKRKNDLRWDFRHFDQCVPPVTKKIMRQRSWRPDSHYNIIHRFIASTQASNLNHAISPRCSTPSTGGAGFLPPWSESVFI